MTKYEDLPRDGNGDIDPAKVEFPVEIPLLRPLEDEDRKIASVTLREPVATDVELCWNHAGEMTRMVHLLANLAELSPAEVRSLKSVDFMRAAGVAGAFL